MEGQPRNAFCQLTFSEVYSNDYYAWTVSVTCSYLNGLKAQQDIRLRWRGWRFEGNNPPLVGARPMCPPNAGMAYHHRLNRRKYVVPTLGRHTGLPLHRNIYKVAKYRQVDIAESTSRYRQIHLSILRNRNNTALNSKLMQKKWKVSHGTLSDSWPSRRFKSNEYYAWTVSVPCS